MAGDPLPLAILIKAGKVDANLPYKGKESKSPAKPGDCLWSARWHVSRKQLGPSGLGPLAPFLGTGPSWGSVW